MQYINYRENRKRGTDDFPLEFHHVTKLHPQYVMSLHWHVEFEFIRILSGSFTLTIDEDDYTLMGGDFAIIPAGNLHSGVPHDCEYECIVFDLNMLINKNDFCNSFCRQLSEHEIDIQCVYPASCTEIKQCVEQLFETVSRKANGYPMISLGCLYQIFGAIYSNSYFQTNSDISHRHHRRILQLKQSLEYMELNYNKQLSLGDISSSINMSPKYFCRFFQEMTHRSPIDYLNNYRIERACYQLMTTDLSITDIAFASGFNDLSYFIKTFKKYKGVTPKKYLRI